MKLLVCNECAGTGEIYDTQSRCIVECKKCRGSGMKPEIEKIKLEKSYRNK